MSARGATVAVIPARYASSRFPGKPLAMIGAKPMIVRVMERARAAALVDRVLVATDDRRIADAVREAGGEAVMTPAEVPSGSDRIALVARSLEDAAIIVNVQGDEPLIPPAVIDDAVRPLRDDPAIDAGTLARPLRSAAEWEDPNVTKVLLDGSGRCLWFSRSPLPRARGLSAAEILRTCPVYAHVGLYVYRKEFLIAYAAMPQTPFERAEQLEQLRILEHGHALRAVVTAYESIAVDTPGDLERVRAACAREDNARQGQQT
ncbi:MAG TPA: 3-deoxy-manno-octulosonate cytidylyltransferase [Bacteroidota bacterium]|nr:3-deoxy-manno-octulosonate cytidylyltransferase [Bacteroidota bacterium]